MDEHAAAADSIARALARVKPKDRAQLLREFLAHASAGLIIIVGDKEAAESVYRLADAIITKGSPEPSGWDVR